MIKELFFPKRSGAVTQVFDYSTLFSLDLVGTSFCVRDFMTAIPESSMHSMNTTMFLGQVVAAMEFEG